MKGAQRWFDFGFFSLQPSEILKPALVVVWAWMLERKHEAAALSRARRCRIALYALAAAALLAQPDIGQTALLGLCSAPMLILSGMALRWVLGGGALAALGGVGDLSLLSARARARRRVPQSRGRRRATKSAARSTRSPPAACSGAARARA